VTVVLAPAKLTVSLRITGVRDDGLHLIDAEMVTLDLADELYFGEGDGLEIVPAAAGLPVPYGPDNLVARALARIGRRAAVRLHKRVPAGAGLGGGSADAAAVLRWAGVSDLALAVELGADVPFCLVGGRARVRGIGEVVEPLAHADRTYTLLVPPFGCATGAVYAAWDDLGGPVADGPNDLEPAPHGRNGWASPSAVAAYREPAVAPVGGSSTGRTAAFGAVGCGFEPRPPSSVDGALDRRR
jgi:4-diphosphocytidyl-2-C-methyl-D-erythritol kinase